MSWLRKQYERQRYRLGRMGRRVVTSHFSGEDEETKTAVVHPIDRSPDPTYESVEEREWRIERNTMLKKGEG